MSSWISRTWRKIVAFDSRRGFPQSCARGYGVFHRLEIGLGLGIAVIAVAAVIAIVLLALKIAREAKAAEDGVEVVRRQTAVLGGIARINDSGVRILHAA